MSYSFHFRAANRTEAMVKAEGEFDQIVAAQHTHVQDEAIVIATLSSMLDLLEVDPTKDIQVNINGSVGWNYNPDADLATVPLTQVAASVNVWLVPKE